MIDYTKLKSLMELLNAVGLDPLEEAIATDLYLDRERTDRDWNDSIDWTDIGYWGDVSYVMWRDYAEMSQEEEGEHLQAMRANRRVERFRRQLLVRGADLHLVDDPPRTVYVIEYDQDEDGSSIPF